MDNPLIIKPHESEVFFDREGELSYILKGYKT